MKITVFGCGYVGLVTGACLADMGHDVTIVDNNSNKIIDIQNDIIPIYEDGLKELVIDNKLNGTLHFTTDSDEAIKNAEVIFIAVGTPPSETDGHADITFVMDVVLEVALKASGPLVLVTKSTVPVGTGEAIDNMIKRFGHGHTIHVVSNPEFLREGVAIRDFMQPDRIVIGAECTEAFEIMNKVYGSIVTSHLHMNRKSAELAKYGANAFLAAKIAFINEMANLCEASGGVIEDVAMAIGYDSRIGKKFLKAGPGFGGSCFPKDILALVKTARDYNTPINLIETVIEINEQRKVDMALKIYDVLGTIKGKSIAIFGLTFKAETDDMRSAPSLTIITELQRLGARIKAYDPEGMPNAKLLLNEVQFCETIYDCVTDVDAVVILTEWRDFHHSVLDYSEIKRRMYTPNIIDLRNLLNQTVMEKLGFNYTRIGR